MTRACPTWNILVTTIPHRHEKLCGLLADLDGQITACEAAGRVGVIVYRDNLTHSYGGKTRALQEASTADYVSCVDDDDLLAPDGVARILIALGSEPDFVGFCIGWTRDGVPQARIEHSLRFGGWGAAGEGLFRDISEKNPMRRAIALAGHWEGGYGAEARWAESLRTAGLLKTEEWLPDPPVYLYRESTADTFLTGRQACAEIKPLPSYPWLRVLETEHSV